MKNSSTVRRAFLLLAAGLSALFCAACPQPDNPQSYSYTVTFYMNDGTAADLGTRIVNSPATTVDSLPAAPARSGFIFAGWNTAADGGGLPFTETTPVKAHIAVYAQWGSAPGYTVYFDQNGGTRAANPAAKQTGAPAMTVGSLPVPPEKDGYAFAGWNTAADGTGTPFTANTEVTGDITVYAQWRLPRSYTVSFNNNGGDTEADPAAMTVTEPVATVGVLPAQPQKNGYVFAGWNTAADGTGAPFAAGTMVTGDLTVYARWVLPYTYTVTFNNNGGATEANPATKQINAPDTTIDALPAQPEKTGYAFGGWNTSMTGAYGMPFTATTTVTGDIIVYAQWQSYTYTVTFDVNGGDAPVSPRTVSSPATTPGVLPTPAKGGGAFFGGWNTAADGNGTPFTANTVVTGNITVYARWVEGLSNTGIVLRFEDPGLSAWDQALVGDSFTIKQGGVPPSRTIALAGGWTNPEWRLDGKSLDTTPSVTLNAGDYNVGGHTLQVTAYQGGVPWSKTVPFRVIAGVSSLALNKTALILAPGQGETLLPRFTPANAEDQSVTWTVHSANPAGAVTVNPATGLISAVNVGTATIRATSVDNPAAYADCAVTVGASQGIMLRFEDPGQEAWDSAEVGETFTLYQNGTDPEEPLNRTVALAGSWTSQEWKVDGGSLGSAASVTLNAGDYNAGGHTLQVTAYQGGIPWSKTVSFRVVATVTGLALNKAALALAPGQSEKLLPRFTPANAEDQSVTWTILSANPAGAVTVDSATGLVSAVSIGIATVRVTSGDTATAYADCAVTVGASQGITLRFEDPGLGAWDSALVGETFSISKGGPVKTITLAGSWDSSPPPDWRVDGRPQGGAAGTVAINAVNYALGGHTLQVTVYQGGIPWSKTVTFAVTN
jgi:uncharacterized repeat protein (TIGR02543 family)